MTAYYEVLNNTETFEDLRKALKASPRKFWLLLGKAIDLSLWLLGDVTKTAHYG